MIFNSMSTPIQRQVVIVELPKNPAAAALLGFLLGPMGLIYAGRIWPAVIMFIVSGCVALVTFGIGLFIVWPICAVWAYSSAKAYNKKLMAGTA